ncbi:MAG: apolipoprotein acyltransferase [Pseudomonadota bacterium]
MTLVFILGLGGYGVWRAKKRGGKTLDLIHYGAVYAVMGLIIGTLLTIGLSRLL